MRNYPSHTFVIDFEEATELFGNVREPSEIERNLEKFLREFEGQEGRLCISRPNAEGMVGYLGPKPEESDDKQQRGDESHESARAVATERPGANGGNNQTRKETAAVVRSARPAAGEKAKVAGGETGK